jgi:glutamate 5-kinase
VPRLGAKAFEQSAGFLRVRGGAHPLDASAVHPERYPLVERIARDLGAELLVILTDTPGILSADPRLGVEASLIEEVTRIDATLESAAGGPGELGSGGMASKVAAAKIATWSGIPCVIAAAGEERVLERVLGGEAVGTRFRPRPRRLGARKVWIAFALPARGRLLIDSGAVRALCEKGHSLLPVGIRHLEGDFEAGDAVEVVDEARSLIAKGLVAASASELREIAGRRRDEVPVRMSQEAIHRDDLVVLRE